MIKAAIIGCTGATGAPLFRFLSEAGFYESVQGFARPNPSSLASSPNVTLVNFQRLEEWSHLIRATDIFLCMGSTIRKAGSKQAQYQVDYTYQANFARVARERGARRCFVVSSPGADSKSSNFYLRMKGELDDYIRDLGFETVLIKPSLICAQRPEIRLGEKLGAFLLSPVCRLPGLRHFRPIDAEDLARAVCLIATSGKTLRQEYALGDIHALLQGH